MRAPLEHAGMDDKTAMPYGELLHRIAGSEPQHHLGVFGAQGVFRVVRGVGNVIGRLHLFLVVHGGAGREGEAKACAT
eukprot:11156667-Lingulodinium_polyedra.AAC.1